jgi:hypothetical protein
MYERAVEQAADDIRRRRRRAQQAAWLATAALSAAGLIAFFSLPIAAAFIAGALLEGLIAADSVYRRRELISCLALQPAAYALPEVAAFGEKAMRPRQRARLAAWLSEVVADAHAPHSLCLGDRVMLVADELEALACALISPSGSIEAPSVVACRRLLTDMVDSPLYNSALPVGDLHDAVHRIRAGMA